VMDALKEADGDDAQQKRIEDRLKEAGWLKRGGLLGLGGVVRSDDDD